MRYCCESFTEQLARKKITLPAPNNPRITPALDGFYRKSGGNRRSLTVNRGVFGVKAAFSNIPLKERVDAGILTRQWVPEPLHIKEENALM